MLIVLEELVDLLLSQEFDTLTGWRNDKHSWVDEILGEWILANLNLFDVSLSLEWLSISMIMEPFAVPLKEFIFAFL